MNARSVYLIILPIVKASRNFLTGYCMAPTPNRNGSMGTGGGSRAGIAIAPKPQRSNLLYTLSKVLDGKPAREGFFPPCARQPVRHKAPCHRTSRRHQGVVKPQLFFPCRQEDRQHVHASRQRDDGVVEKPQGNKTQTT